MQPEWLAAIFPLRPGRGLSGTDRQSRLIGGENRSHRDEFGRGALHVTEVRFADFFAHRNHDSLPVNHGARAERDGH